MAEDLDVAGKRVVVIGSGATAVTLIPSLADTAAHVTMLQRLADVHRVVAAKDPVADLLRKVLPASVRLRHPVVQGAHHAGMYQLSRRRPELVKRLLRAGLKKQLPKGYDIDHALHAEVQPVGPAHVRRAERRLFQGDQRRQPRRWSPITSTRSRRRASACSRHRARGRCDRHGDGLELLFIGGIQASVDGEPVDLPNKLTLQGMMLEGVPNFALAVGYTNASWTLKCDLTCQYVTRLLNRMHETGLQQCTPVNHDDTVVPQPLLGLSSGYVQRSADRFPKQGSKFPWQVHQSYRATTAH